MLKNMNSLTDVKNFFLLFFQTKTMPRNTEMVSVEIVYIRFQFTSVRRTIVITELSLNMEVENMIK